MLSFNWKFLTPLAVCMVFITALVDKLVVELGGALLVRTLVLFVVNLGVYWISSETAGKEHAPECQGGEWSTASGNARCLRTWPGCPI